MLLSHQIIVRKKWMTRAKKSRKAGENGLPANHYFDNKYYTDIWIEYFQPGTSDLRKEAIRQEIVLASLRISKIIIRMYRLTQFATEDDLTQEATYKVLRDFEKFNYKIEGKKNAASAYVFITTIIKNHLLTFIYKARKYQHRVVFLDQLTTHTEIEDSSADTTSETYHIDLEQTMDESYAVDELRQMVACLDDQPIGQAILEYLGISGVDKLGLTSSEDYTITSEDKRMNLRSLTKYLREERGFSLKDCSQYLGYLKNIYHDEDIDA